MIPVQVTPPAALLTLPEVKAHLMVDPQITDEDDLIASMMVAAEGYLDGWNRYLGRCILPQTWTITVPALADLALPFCDAGAVTITYWNAAQVQVTLDTSLYSVWNDIAASVRFVPAVAGIALADRPDAVTITADYGMVSDPAPIRTAAKIMIASWFRNREGEGDLPPAAAALLKPYRKVWS